MRIYLHELSEDSKQLEFTDKDAWILEAVQDTQEYPLNKAPEFSVSFDLRKSQEIVFLKGRLKVDVGLICSRCANGFDYNIVSQYKYLFTRNRALVENTSSIHLEQEEDLDIECLEREYIELADVLKEQIYLKIPFQPLCKESCKGICPVCGQDQNTQPCQCYRIKNPALANALKNFKLV